MNSLAQAGLGDTIRVYQTSGGYLQLVATTKSGTAKISVQDLGGGTRLADALGISSQVVSGTDASRNAGLARRLDVFLDGYVGRGGVINEKVRLGGVIDQELLSISRRIEEYEYRLSLYEARLRNQFAQMEVALALFQQTSQFIEARMNAMLSQQTGGGGIAITL